MRISSDSWGMARSSEWRTQTPLKGLPEDRLHVQGEFLEEFPHRPGQFFTPLLRALLAPRSRQEADVCAPCASTREPRFWRGMGHRSGAIRVPGLGLPRTWQPGTRVNNQV
jgi:hypothetical protein